MRFLFKFAPSKYSIMRSVALFILAVLSIITGCTQDTTTNFELVTVVQPVGSGQILASQQTFEDGTPLTLTAAAAAGYQFSHWSNDGTGTENPLTLNGTQNLQVTAHFVPLITDNINAYQGGQVHDGYVFAINNGGTQTHLLNKSGQKVYSWSFESKLGNDIEWMSNGNLLGIFKPAEELPFSFGGYGGILRELRPNGNTLWEYTQADANGLLHHDVLALPNGNVLSMIWERIEPAAAQAMGADVTYPIYPEKIVEIDPTTNEIVWQWRAVDHLVQNHNPEAANFGNPSEQPHKIDINYQLREDGDLMHANGLAYDAEKDLIFMSVNFYSEVWVIDHSQDTDATTAAAGDLLYRFGNPTAFGDTQNPRLFHNNHHPHLIQENGTILLYNNGSNRDQSEVIELRLPQNPNLSSGTYIAPEVVWSYTHPDLFFGKISGAVRLPNGNTLICEGDYGYWEVTPEGEIVWQYESEVNVWRGYGIENNDPRLNFLNLNP